MRVPVLSLLVASIFHSGISSFGQTAEKALLQFDGYAGTLGVNKDEQVIVGTRMGEVAFTDSINGFWRKSKVKPKVGFLLNSAVIDDICYFNADTAFVSGYFSNNDKYNIIYHTVDGGKSWLPIEYGFDGVVNDAAFLDNGEAWLSVAKKGIAYTKDYGFTWDSLSLPNMSESFGSIYFNSKREGIIGSMENVIAYTPDNCKTWRSIPTPLTQEKYKKTATGFRSQINRVAIFKEYLLVSQENLVFYSKKGTVNWVLMPGYTDFYTDSENSALYFKTRKGSFVKCDNKLQPVSSTEKIGYTYAAICRNGNLFILGERKMWQINGAGKMFTSPIYTNNTADLKPIVFNYASNGYMGNIGSDVYKQKGGNSPWEYAFTLPFATDSGSLRMKDSGTILFRRNDDSLFYYDISSAKLGKRSQKEMMESFCASGIISITFSKGSQGCFHSASTAMIYQLQGGRFVLSGQNNKGGGHFLKDNDEEIEQQGVEEFVKKIPVIYNKRATIEDLEFTQREYEVCKRNIKAYKTYLEGQGSARKAKEKECAFIYIDNNLDFSKLIALVDSVKTVDQSILNDALSSSEVVSTSSLWAGIKLVNMNNEEMEISTIYFEPTAFYFPWTIKLNGTISTNTAIEINRFLNGVFPNFLDKNDKVSVVQRIVKELYRQQQ